MSCLEKPQEFRSPLKRGFRDIQGESVPEVRWAQRGLTVGCKAESLQRPSGTRETQAPALTETAGLWPRTFSRRFFSCQRTRPPQFRPHSKGPAVVRFAQCVCGHNGTVRLAAANTPMCKPRPSAEEALGANAWKWIRWHFKDKHLLGYDYRTSNPKLEGGRIEASASLLFAS